jgi:hypothetical protein
VSITVTGLPHFNDNTTVDFVALQIDKEVAAAQHAQSEFKEANPPPEFLTAWGEIIATLQDLSKLDKNPRVRPDGSDPTLPVGDTEAALRIEGHRQDVDKAKVTMQALANRNGYSQCGAIQWSY